MFTVLNTTEVLVSNVTLITVQKNSFKQSFHARNNFEVWSNISKCIRNSEFVLTFLNDLRSTIGFTYSILSSIFHYAYFVICLLRGPPWGGGVALRPSVRPLPPIFSKQESSRNF